MCKQRHESTHPPSQHTSLRLERDDKSAGGGGGRWSVNDTGGKVGRCSSPGWVLRAHGLMARWAGSEVRSTLMTPVSETVLNTYKLVIQVERIRIKLGICFAISDDV